MGSGGLDSPFSPFNSNPIDPRVDLACNMIETITNIGESIEDYYKNKPNPECSKCGEEIKYGSNEDKCSNCKFEEESNIKSKFEGDYQKQFCLNCQTPIIPINPFEKYCPNCKQRIGNNCRKCGNPIDNIVGYNKFFGLCIKCYNYDSK